MEVFTRENREPDLLSLHRCSIHGVGRDLASSLRIITAPHCSPFDCSVLRSVSLFRSVARFPHRILDLLSVSVHRLSSLDHRSLPPYCADPGLQDGMDTTSLQGDGSEKEPLAKGVDDRTPEILTV